MNCALLKIVHNSLSQYFILFNSHITLFFTSNQKCFLILGCRRCRLRHHLSCCITIFTFSLLPFACKFFPLLFFILFYIFYIHKHFFRWNQGLSTQHSIKAFKRHCETCMHNFTYKMNKRGAEKIEEAKWNENLSGIFIQLFAMLSYN